MQERFSFVLLKSMHDLLHVLTRTCSVHHSQRRQQNWTARMTWFIITWWRWWRSWCSWRTMSTRSSLRVRHCGEGRTTLNIVFLMNGVVFLVFSKVVWSYWQAVGMTLRSLIRSVDDILPTLHESIRIEVKHRQTKAIEFINLSYNYNCLFPKNEKRVTVIFISIRLLNCKIVK